MLKLNNPEIPAALRAAHDKIISRILDEYNFNEGEAIYTAMAAALRWACCTGTGHETGCGHCLWCAQAAALEQEQEARDD